MKVSGGVSLDICFVLFRKAAIHTEKNQPSELEQYETNSQVVQKGVISGWEHIELVGSIGDVREGHYDLTQMRQVLVHQV